MRIRIARWSLAGTSAAVALMIGSTTARAQQVDTNPPLPNVLLLLDNSGSMERMIDGNTPETEAPCNCNAATGVCNWAAQPAPNRWGVMLQALTGTMANGYNCAAMPRAAATVFGNEYQIAGTLPYDANPQYYLPFHRPIAKDTSSNPATSCVYAPASLPGALTPNGVGTAGTGAGGKATDFPSNAVVNRPYGALGVTSNTCAFTQYSDGAIDTARDLMRFGLMTFDTDVDPGTGVNTTPTVVNPAFKGMWSYFPGWNTGAACTYSGNPVGCVTSMPFAVGARNPAAPPWEGRMMYFPTTSDITTQETNNDHVQTVIQSTRPYGATPIAGMFTGAQYFFWTDPNGPQQTDGYVQGDCRNQYIILLTDGAPNLDLQNACSAAGNPPPGKCPFPLPQDTAATLYNNGKAAGTNQFVTTYVIGFAVSSFNDVVLGPVQCSQFAQSGVFSSQCDCTTATGLPAATPNPYNDKKQPCCELQCIAQKGGSSQAYFADNPGDLQNALGAIFASISKNTTTRTTPAYSPIVANVLADPNTPQTNESIYLASFNPSPGLPWSGDVQRQRYQCTFQNNAYTVPTPTVNNALGDDFAANLNSHAGPVRTFIALEPDQPGSGARDSTATIRPYVATNVGDNLGKYSATTFAGQASNVIPSITPDALGSAVNAGCTYWATNGGGQKSLTGGQCRDMLLDFTFGQQTFSGPADFPFVSRYGNAFGDIFHATPAVVGPPSALLRDDLYVAFRQNWQLCAGGLSPPNCRKTVLYAATNDGLLHAFWADEGKLENNEMWAMAPPAVMPNFLSAYPSSHQFLLDGSPVAKDVVWDRAVGSNVATVWHTMLLAGFGPSERGYYAVDVTNPDVSSMPTGVVPTDPAPPGPVFMWQLTNTQGVPGGAVTNAQLFGAHSGTPAITTILMDPGDGKGTREIGVAVLPGGQETGPTSSAANGPACARVAKATDAAPPSGYQYRTNVRCWGVNQKAADPVVGRSLTIARLDTGEILRTFMRKADAPVTDTLKIANRIIDTPLDSPITGAPMTYPSDVGSDTTKIFVGDADGTIWRFDVSNPDPNKWIGELYVDLYNQQVDTAPTAWADGQPLQLPPAMSLDSAGLVVLNAATGTQEVFDNTGINYIYSITEKVQGNPAKLRANVNWWFGTPPGGCVNSNTACAQGGPSCASNVACLQPGERVSGPMTVFDSTFYFATYAAAPPGTQVCAGGNARLWGLDFEIAPGTTPDPTKGGIMRFYNEPGLADPTLAGRVIPGVSVKSTPACASLGSLTGDSYFAGGQHAAPQNFTPGSYSLFTQVGKKGTNGNATQPFETPLPTPVSPTIIDSWAAVLE